MALAVGDGALTLEGARAWLGISADQLPDLDLSRMWETAKAAQVNACRDLSTYTDETFPAALTMALLRRVARMIAARDLPLGYLADTDFGPARLLNFDAPVEEYEGPWRKAVSA